MNADPTTGSWKQLKRQLKQRWGNLTDDDLDTIGGKRERLVGKIQERYGISREEAEEEAEAFDAVLQGLNPH